MATKYGYVQRDPQDTQLNWSQIATDTVDMLNAEVKTREDKKAAIDQATADYQTILNNVPQGENTQLNEFALNAAEKLQKQMLMQETLLKSGQLNPKQYTIMRQNLSDGTDQAFSLMQDYNDEYSAKMAMMSADLPVAERASQMQTWMMEQVEGFSNFTSTELVVNPQTGIMSMAKLIPDPKYKGSGTAPLIPDPDPNNLVTVQQLQNRIKTKYTQYDVVGNAEEWIETLGEDKRVEIATLGSKYQAGIFKTVKNIRNREGGFKDKTPEELQKLATEMGVDVDDIAALSKFEEAQNTFIEGQLFSNSNIGASVLLDFARKTPDGTPYELTFDPDAAAEDESVILLKSVNGRVQAELTDAQEAVATEAYKAQIDIGLDIEETVEVRQVYKEPRAKTPTEIAAGEEKEDSFGILRATSEFYAAKTPQQIEAAANKLMSLNPNIKDIKRVGKESATITYFNYGGAKNAKKTLNFKDDVGEFQNQKTWSTSSFNFFAPQGMKIRDDREIEKALGDVFTYNEPTDKTLDVGMEIPRGAYINDVSKKEISRDEAVMRVIEKEMPAKGSLFVEDNEEVSAPAISAYLEGTGYSAKQSDGWTDDAITLYKDGVETDIIFNIDPGADEYGRVDEYMNTLINIKFNSLDENQKYDEAEKLEETVTNKKGATGAAP